MLSQTKRNDLRKEQSKNGKKGREGDDQGEETGRKQRETGRDSTALMPNTLASMEELAARGLLSFR